MNTYSRYFINLTSSRGYIQLYVPYDLQQRRTTQAMSSHGTCLSTTYSKAYHLEYSWRKNTWRMNGLTISHCIVFWEVLKIACLHARKVLYLTHMSAKDGKLARTLCTLICRTFMRVDGMFAKKLIIRKLCNNLQCP